MELFQEIPWREEAGPYDRIYIPLGLSLYGGDPVYSGAGSGKASRIYIQEAVAPVETEEYGMLQNGYCAPLRCEIGIGKIQVTSDISRVHECIGQRIRREIVVA